MATTSSTTTDERSSLLRATSPRANGGHSSLNPRASSFTFVPGRTTFSGAHAPSPSQQQQQPLPPASITPNSSNFPPLPTRDQPATAAAVDGSTTPKASHSTSPSFSQPSTSTSPQQLGAFASTTLVRTRSASVASTASADSIHSDHSSISSSSSCDACPTKRQFRRSHYAQFAISAALVVLAFVLLVLWKHEIRFAELLVGASAWLAGEALRPVIFDLMTWESKDEEGAIRPATGLVLPTAVHTVVQSLLRLGGIILVVGLLPEPDANTIQGSMPSIPPPRHGGRGDSPRAPLPPLDELFFSALWFAMGWALVEITWHSRDLWQRVGLYDDVLDEDEGAIALDEEAAFDRPGNEARQIADYGSTAATTTTNGLDKSHDNLIVSSFDREVEERLSRETEEAEFEARLRAIERDELEAQFGVPLFEIPIAVVVIWRIDSILMSLVATLVLSLPFRTSTPTLVSFQLWPTFFVITLVHILLTMMWTLRVKHVGIPAISYTTLVVLLFLLFATLAAWGALE